MWRSFDRVCGGERLRAGAGGGLDAGTLTTRRGEDAMQVVAAEAFSAQTLVTRNLADFAASPVKAMRPSELAPLLEG